MQADPLIGRQLGNYAIERVIGQGGMAVVYFGRDVKLNRPAAIKVIDARFRDNPNYTGRFLQEAKMVAAWRHEHILQIYYADDEHFPDLGKLFFFAMEYIDGSNLAETLSTSIKTQGSVPPEDVLKYGRAIASALDYAHTRGVIHRDVKPANVLVSKDGRVVLSDFGLALEVQQGSIGEVFGSAHYIAPEQARRSSDAVAQSDLYSLGVILYEMLTGVVPFDDPSPTSVALQHITLPPPRPREINPDLSEEVEAVLLKALSKTPSDRYTRGAELINAIEGALVRMNPSVPTRKQIPLPAASAQRKAITQSGPQGERIRAARSPALITMAIAAGAALLLFCVLATSILWKWRGVPAAAVSTSPTASVATQVAALPHPSQAAHASTDPVFSSASPSATPGEPTSLPATETVPALLDTPTIAISSTPSAQPTITWTPKYGGGRRMILSWNDSSFYMLQVTGYGELIDPLVFERLTLDGAPGNRFRGTLWAELHAATLRDWCMRLEIDGPAQPADLPPFLRPAACENHYLASRWPSSGDPVVFWTHQDDSRQFRILWGRDEIQRCEIDAGTCEVYLP